MKFVQYSARDFVSQILSNVKKRLFTSMEKKNHTVTVSGFSE